MESTNEGGSRRWLLVVVAVLVVAAGLLGWRLGQLPGRQAEAETETGPSLPPLPDIALAVFGGGEMNLAGLPGKVVVVDFWASWCGPCRLQAQILGQLHRDLADRGLEDEVQFVAINLGESEQVVARYVADHAFPYPVLMDPREIFGERLQIFALPTVMILDRRGEIVYLEPGISDRPTLGRALAEQGVRAAA